MKVTKRELKSIIRKNLAKELNETLYSRGESKFKFDYCDLGDIELTKPYKTFMSFKDKASKSQSSKEIAAIERKLAEITPAQLTASPELEAQRESLLKNLERAKQAQAVGLESLFDKEFMGYTLGGMKTPAFMNNLSFLINVGAYASMGPAAALYCKTLKNVLTVINAGVDAYTEEYEEKSALGALSEFDRFYILLDRSIGFKSSGSLTFVLNNYFKKYSIDSAAGKALFKLFFLKELIYFSHEGSSSNPSGGKGLPLNSSSEKEAASSAFESLIKNQSKKAKFQALIRKIKRKPERNNLTRQIRKHLENVLEYSPDEYASYVKDDSFKMRELESYLAKNFIEGGVMRKTADDNSSISKVDDFKMLINDIQKVGDGIT